MKSLSLKNNNTGRLRGETLTAYLFLSPWIIGFILFSGFPMIASFLLSLTNWSLMKTPEFTGLTNYIRMFKSSSQFLNSFKVTIIFTLGSVVFTLLWALILAMLLEFTKKGQNFFQFIYFIPAVLPSVSLAFVFQLIFNQHTGILNYFLTFFGIHNGPNWLFSEIWVMPTVIFVCIYTYSTGQMMLLFKAGLKEVPIELYEAASIDGVRFFQKFFYITIPAISPVIFFNMVMAIISSLNNSFSLLFPLTNGGPNNATNVLSLSIYNTAFGNYQMGYASAISMALFLLVAVFSLLQFKLSNKWVHYEA